MIHLLDTDTLIFMLRGLKPSARRQARDRAHQLVDRCQAAQRQGSAVGVSAITVCELEFGARKSGRYEQETAAVAKVLAPFELYDFGQLECAPHYGAIRLHLETASQGIGAMDMLIAAHALGLGATLVTNNTAHFSRVPGLRLTDWKT